MISLRALLSAASCDKVPRGWLTKDELSEAEGLSPGGGRVNNLIREALKAGLLEKKNFRVLWGGYPRARPHYRRVK